MSLPHCSAKNSGPVSNSSCAIKVATDVPRRQFREEGKKG
jgi:hypothetical protein